MPRSSATRSTPTAMPYMIPQQGRSTYAPFSSKAVQETTRHSDQLFKRQGQGNTLFALSSFRATRILKKKGGEGGGNSKIKPDWFLLNRIQYSYPTHTHAALKDAMYNIPCHFTRAITEPTILRKTSPQHAAAIHTRRREGKQALVQDKQTG